MVRLVDVPLDAGDPSRAVADLTASIEESRSPPAERQAPKAQESRQINDVGDPRFAGKSTAEIVEMYRNLESHSGRLASQLGETRKTVDQLILGKRENDLRAGSGERTKVTPTDLMVDPTNALDRYFQERTNPEVSSLKQRLEQLESQLSQTVFSVNHPKAQDVTADPAFAAWVRQTPLRSMLAEAAANGDLRQADLLLKEWQNAQASGESTPTNSGNRAQELAKRVSLESSGPGSEDGRSARRERTFSRRDLQALRIRDPEKYESLGDAITKAYLENRITD
jgi:hypothetical protein